MSRLTTLLVLLLGVLVGGLGTVMLTRPALDEGQVREIAAEVVAEQPNGLTQQAVEAIVVDLVGRQPKQDVPQAVAAIDPAELNPMIEDYLLKNPRVLQRVSAALDAEIKADRVAANRAALAELKPAIYEDAGHVVLDEAPDSVTAIADF